MTTLFLSLWCAAAPADAPRTAPVVLREFRQEFIQLTPGKNGFPERYVCGDAAGPASSRPPRTVRMTEPFGLAKYETTQEVWQVVTGGDPSRWKGRRNSVEMLSWEEAEAFCEKLTKLLREQRLIEADEAVRLPTEAEWEYAARAGSTTRYSFGDEVEKLDAYAWHHGNAAGNDPPVGAKKPNAWGFHDMHGYLWEWCADPAHDDYANAPGDARVWNDGGDAKKRMLRSGSWKDGVESLESARRRIAPADLKDDAVGLRCVLSKVPTAAKPESKQP